MNLQEFFKFVCFPHIYGPKHKIWCFFMRLTNNGKFLGNRQTKENFFVRLKYNNFCATYFFGVARTQIEKNIEHFKGPSYVRCECYTKKIASFKKQSKKKNVLDWQFRKNEIIQRKSSELSLITRTKIATQINNIFCKISHQYFVK